MCLHAFDRLTVDQFVQHLSDLTIIKSPNSLWQRFPQYSTHTPYLICHCDLCSPHYTSNKVEQ